jgi:hypothetical protein
MEAEVDSSDLDLSDGSNVVLPAEAPYEDLSMDVEVANEANKEYKSLEMAYSDEELMFAPDPPLPTAPYSPPLADNPHSETRDRSRRAWVEDVADDDDVPQYASNDRWFETFPMPAGTPKGRGRPNFEKHGNMQKVEGSDPWSPFTSKEEWELARWLMCSGVSQTKIDKFLKLDIVRMFWISHELWHSPGI